MINSIPTTDNWQERLEYVATKQGFDFTLNEEGSVTLQKFSPCRQDFTVELESVSDYRDALRQLSDRAERYDVNEEAMLWYGAKRGEPQDLQALLDDMKWCKHQLQDLSDAVDHYYSYSPADYFNEAVLEQALSQTFEEYGLDHYSFSDEMQKILLDRMSDYDNPLLALEEISTHGCASGVLPAFTYYSDTKEFYMRHMEDVEEYITDLGEEMGEPIMLSDPHYNSATWLVAEQCAYYASEEIEVFMERTVGSLSEELTAEQAQAFLERNQSELIVEKLEERVRSLTEKEDEEQQNTRLDALVS